MRCPNCGNEVYERLDYAIVQCVNCLSLWDPFVYPGFPEPDVDIGELWDTTEPSDEEWTNYEIDENEEPDELDDEELDDEELDDDELEEAPEDWEDDLDVEDEDLDEELDDWEAEDYER
jgi:hypothetical protein